MSATASFVDGLAGKRPATPTARASAPRQQSPTLQLTSIGDLLAEPDDAVDWLVQGRIPMGSVCLMASKPKVGKSTAARHLALAVAHGDRWLDGDCHPGTVWYLGLEGRRQDHKAHFRRMGAAADDPIWLFIGRAPKNVVAAVRERATQERPALIIIDTLQRFIKATSMDDYAEITSLFDLVLDIARSSGAALVLLHHAGKADRASIDAVLGSTAITGSVDNIFVLARTAHYRTISTTQRVGDDLEERVLELSDVNGRVSLGSKREDKERQLLAQQLYDALEAADRGLTQAEWFDLVEGRRATKLAALRQLLGEDPVFGTRITRAGAGTRNSPYRYQPVSAAVSSSLVPYRTGNQNLFSSSSSEFPNDSSNVSSTQVPTQERSPGTSNPGPSDDDEEF